MKPDKHIKIAISPCPNDTYIFGPLLNHFIEPESQFKFTVDYLDIQELNQCALQNFYDVIKISAALIPQVLDNYQIASCGGAFTDQTGPLLVALNKFPIEEIEQKTVLLPGSKTTATFLLKFLFPSAKKLSHAVFNEIEQKILNHEADAGVIIHESRFNFHSKGLVEILDLGKAWYQRTHTPVPLGVIAINRKLSLELRHNIKSAILKSLFWSHENWERILPYVISKSSELELDVIKKHIAYYVNSYTEDIGASGKEALIQLQRFLGPNHKTYLDLI